MSSTNRANLLRLAALGAVAVLCLTMFTRQAADARPAQDRTVHELTFESLGHVGGAYTGIVTRGHVGFASVGHRLQVLDISDSTSPAVLVESDELPAPAVLVALNDTGGAYLVDRVRTGVPETSHDVLYVMDAFALPQAPTLKGSLELPGNSFSTAAALGDHLYGAGHGKGVAVVDATDPTAPRLAGTVDVGGYATGVALHRPRMLVSVRTHDGRGGLVVLDLDDPSAPREAGRLDVVGGGNAVVAVGVQHALLDTVEGIRVVDLGDPTRPRLADVSEPAYVGSDVISFAVLQDRVLATTNPVGLGGPFQILILDTSQLPDLKTVGRYYTRWFRDADGAGNQALMAAGPVGLQLLTEAPSDSGSTMLERNLLPALGAPSGIALAGGHLFVTDVDRELWSVDVGTPDAPSIVGRAEYSHPSDVDISIGYGGPLTVRDGVAYTTRLPYYYPKSDRGMPGGLHVFDVRDPTEPRQIGVWDGQVQSQLDPAYVDHGPITNFAAPALVGDRLWLAGYPALTELDVADPSQPQLVRHTDLLNDAPGLRAVEVMGLATDGRRAYVGSGNWGVYSFDVAPDTESRVEAHADTPSWAKDVSLVGSHLLAAGPAPLGLRVLDAQSLDAVRSIEDIYPDRMTVDAGTAYLVGGDRMWLYAVDVADPSQPVLRAAQSLDIDRTPDRALYMVEPSVAVSGDLLALAAADSGVQFMRLEESSPIPVSTAAPTLTPWPTGTPLTTSTPPSETEIPPPTRTPVPTRTPRYGPLYLPMLLSPLFHPSAACPSAGGISAQEAEAYARIEARLVTCGEPVMTVLECMTVREADERYDANLQGSSVGGEPIDSDLCIWWATFEARVLNSRRPPAQPPSATPTSTVSPTEDPCPPAVLMVGFEKPNDWTTMSITWPDGDAPAETPDATRTPGSGSLTLTPTPMMWVTPTP